VAAAERMAGGWAPPGAGGFMPTAEDDWMEWLTEGHRVIEEWESKGQRPLLSVADAAILAERIAHALRRAFDRGRSQPE
jgi:hypothetical protein